MVNGQNECKDFGGLEKEHPIFIYFNLKRNSAI